MKTDRPASEACGRCGETRISATHFCETRPRCDSDSCHAFVAADDAGGAQDSDMVKLGERQRQHFAQGIERLAPKPPLAVGADDIIDCACGVHEVLTPTGEVIVAGIRHKQAECVSISLRYPIRRKPTPTQPEGEAKAYEHATNRHAVRLIRIAARMEGGEGFSLYDYDLPNLRAAADEITGLERERDEALFDARCAMPELEAERDRLAAHVALLVEALEPFAELAAEFSALRDEVTIQVMWKDGHGVYVRVADLRRARAAFKASPAGIGETPLVNAVKAYIAEYGLQHLDDCPEDDTCRCPRVCAIERAMRGEG